MKVSVDTRNPDVLKKPEYKPLEPGTYTFEIANDLAITQSSTGNPQIKIELVCVDETEGVKGHKVYDFISLTEKARARYDVFACLCKACGVTEDASGEVNLEQFKGLRLKAVVKQESYVVNPTTGKRPEPGYTGPTVTKFTDRIDEYLFETA